ncbi:beta-galactosidase [Weissella soli]|uniref:beta-galactosidase n=1 Tax=Weissella soli TaxID=155866 RepID=UPI0021C07E89|nr:beta-galactosidase [Weissella soli]MCT8395025.1 beta-galactosidase [Weissella soli]
MEKQNNLLYGVAYYFEYLPYDRIDEDIKMMLAANINVVRIGESTWSTYEPEDGVFDFSKLIYTLEKMQQAGIAVIVGTPTYAFPAWLAKKYPEVLVENDGQRQLYGRRQIMDITSPVFRAYAERIIRRMLSEVIHFDNIIGYQVDNETKHYGTSAAHVQAAFIQKMKVTFDGDLAALNQAFGLNYWSNRINSWEDFPSVNGTINASLAGAFSKFQRELVTDYLSWQVDIVNDYKKANQFVTHNFDFEWRDYSYGIQPDVNHFSAAQALDVAGVDVYHPSQKQLTGVENSFVGDVARNLKQQNYLVLETQAQAFKSWTPYPGQLYQLAFNHIANGANMVEYWHWHSIHNSFETYWKGLLSHDFQPNPVYNEAKQVGQDFKRLSDKLVNLKHDATVAIVVDNESLTTTSDDRWMEFGVGDHVKYNDVFRRIYDSFYRQNIRTDILNPQTIALDQYALVVVPMLYVSDRSFLQRLNDYIHEGGHVLFTFKDGVADEHIKVRTALQPAIIQEAVGAHYQLFVDPNGEKLRDVSGVFQDSDLVISDWSELLVTDTATSLANYDDHWAQYAAITENHYGAGMAWYLGTWASASVIDQLIKHVVKNSNVAPSPYGVAWPLIVKSAENHEHAHIDFLFNFSDQTQQITLPFDGVELLHQENINSNQQWELAPWSVKILERRDK